jgi:hypothetical protein
LSKDNAGSVVDERGNRKAYNDLVLMKSARVITFTRQEIPHPKKNRHPAFNAGSVVDERGKRKAYNAFV